MIRILAMYFAIAGGILGVVLLWDATRTPEICAPAGWQTVGRHYWVDGRGRQCTYLRPVRNATLWIHPEEWQWQR